MEPVTAKQVAELIAAGCVVWPYPRLGVVSISGKRRQPATAGALKAAAAARKRAEIEKAREAVRAEYAIAGLDAEAEIDGFDAMTADELMDEITYLGDYQG